VLDVHEGQPKAADYSREGKNELMKYSGYEQVAIIANKKRNYSANIDPYVLNRKELLVRIRKRGLARAQIKKNRNI